MPAAAGDGGAPRQSGAARGATLAPELVLGALDATIAVAFAFHLARQMLLPAEIATTDFTVFQAGWELVRRAPRQLYDAAAQAAIERGLLARAGGAAFVNGFMGFLHPPHAALAGAPLGWFADRAGERAAFWLWGACNVGFLAALLRRVRGELGLSARGALLAAVAVAAFPPLFYALREGQVSVLLTLSALGLATAARERRARTAAGWLLLLSIKPQTLPPLIAVLIGRRDWRALAWAGALGGAAALITAVVLGPGVWPDYLAHVRGLERSFGGGTPDYMPNLRGLLTRLLGGRHVPVVDALTLVGWAAATVAAGAVAAGNRRRGVDDARLDFAFGLAAGLVFSPHLYRQDALLWVVPVTLAMASLRTANRPWLTPARLALAAPVWFVIALVADGGQRPRMPIDLTTLAMAAALAWTWRCARAARLAVRCPPGAAA